MKPLKEREKRERHRSEVARKAVEAADRIVLDASDGSSEETNYLTAVVVMKMITKALMPLYTAMIVKDMED